MMWTRKQIQTPLIATLAAAFLFTGCASDSVSKQEYSKPLQVMAAAEQAGAREDSDAAIHMQYAEENLKTANELIDEKEFDEARYYLDMASADAKLALTLAQGKTMRSKVEELEGRIEDVRTDSL